MNASCSNKKDPDGDADRVLRRTCQRNTGFEPATFALARRGSPMPQEPQRTLTATATSRGVTAGVTFLQCSPVLECGGRLKVVATRSALSSSEGPAREDRNWPSPGR